MSERLPRLTPADLSQEQRIVYDGIAGGDRAKGVQHFALTDNNGSLNGPFGVMLHAPGIGAVLQDLGSSIRYRTSLSARVREIAILMVAVESHSDFEWYAHERVGRAAGLSDAELVQLSIGELTSDDEFEQASIDLCRVLLRDSEVAIAESEYDSFVDALGVQPIIELITLVGYYRTLANLMAVFAVGAPTEK